MTDHGPIPVPNSTKPFWRDTPSSLDNHRSTTHLPSESDIVIIGAGFSGAALAHYIYEDNPSAPSVTILEAREACSGATGRNGGHIKPDVYFNTPKYIKKYGIEAAVEVANFEATQVFSVKELVEKEDIDCEFTLTRACDAIVDEQLSRETEAAYAELVKAGVARLQDVQYTPRKHAERVCSPPDEEVWGLTEIGIRGKRGLICLHIHSSPHLAVQARRAPPPKGRSKRSKSANPHTRHPSLRNAPTRRVLGSHHPQRKHQSKASPLRNKRLHVKPSTAVQRPHYSRKGHMQSYRHAGG